MKLGVALTSLSTRRFRYYLLIICCLSAPVTSTGSTAGSEINPDNIRPSLTESEIRAIESMGPWPATPPPDPGNELSGLAWAEALGEELFFSTALSGNGKLSCASCHDPELGFSDGVAVAAGIDNHVRNSQGLLNAGFQRWFGWDGGADSLWAASLRPMLSPIEMGGRIEELAVSLRAMPVVAEAFPNAYPDNSPEDVPDEELVVFAAKAIAAWNRTLISDRTPFDVFRESLLSNDESGQEAYSTSALRGLKTFIGEANCRVCHFGPNFSNAEFHDIGRPFFTGVGQVDSGRHSGIKRVRTDRYNLTGQFNGTNIEREKLKTASVKIGQTNFGQWRTPSLRNVSLTAPYMHDGSLPTLSDVIDFYADIDTTRLHAKGESILKPLELDESAREDLVHFLESLTPASQ